jgi:diacylglycerol kinase (ATP)
MTSDKKLLIIFNPLSGKKYHDKFKKKFISYLNDCQAGCTYDWLDTEPDFEEQLLKIDFDAYSKIIVIGGDGTIRELSEYLIVRGIDLPVAIVPEGSANILAVNLNIPHNTIKAVKNACQGRVKTIDVVKINESLYCNVCLGLGYWSMIIRCTSQQHKIRWGNLAYLMTFLLHSKKYQTLFKFDLDGQHYEINGNTMVVANALSIFKIKPLTPIDFNDGLLEVIIFRHANFWDLFISSLSFILGKKKFPLLFKIKGKEISINGETLKNNYLQIDGESFELKKITAQIIPEKMKFIVPR